MGSDIKISLMHFCCIKSEMESYYRIKLKCRIFNVHINIQSEPSNVSYLAPSVPSCFCTAPTIQLTKDILEMKRTTLVYYL